MDPETLDTPHLEQLLDRYADLWEERVIFEINERVTTKYVLRLKTLQADFNLRYCADDVNAWSESAKSALLERVEMSKVDYPTFQNAMVRRADNPKQAIDEILQHKIPGKPLIVEGVSNQSYRRFLTRNWSADVQGNLYGQGYDVLPGPPWDDWTRDLRSFGLPGGHVFREKRSSSRR
jgi:hypothetical protein